MKEDKRFIIDSRLQKKRNISPNAVESVYEFDQKILNEVYPEFKSKIRRYL